MPSDGADAGEGEGHGGDQRPVAQADEVGRAMSSSPSAGSGPILTGMLSSSVRASLGGEHGRLALLDDVLGAADRARPGLRR